MAASVSIARETKEPLNRSAAAEGAGAVAGTSATEGDEVVAGGTVASDVAAGAVVGLGDGEGLTATCMHRRCGQQSCVIFEP